MVKDSIGCGVTLNSKKRNVGAVRISGIHGEAVLGGKKVIIGVMISLNHPGYIPRYFSVSADSVHAKHCHY